MRVTLAQLRALVIDNQNERNDVVFDLELAGGKTLVAESTGGRVYSLPPYPGIDNGRVTAA